jgi:hypothetical protein
LSIKFNICQTWDAKPIPKTDWTYFQLDILENNDLKIQIDAPFYDDPIPDAASGSLWGLWDYEVVEIFLVAKNGHYTELEFSPHGHYLTLRLDAPRSILAKEEVLQYHAKINGNRWKGQSIVPEKLLPKQIHRVNFFAIHGQNELRQYLCHSPLPHEKPDFHQTERFPLFPKIET